MAQTAINDPSRKAGSGDKTNDLFGRPQGIYIGLGSVEGMPVVIQLFVDWLPASCIVQKIDKAIPEKTQTMYEVTCGAAR